MGGGGGWGGGGVWAFVPIEAEPGEALEDGEASGFGVALLICILDAEDELALVFPGEEPVKEGGAGAADVEVAGG